MKEIYTSPASRTVALMNRTVLCESNNPPYGSAGSLYKDSNDWYNDDDE